MIIRLAKIPNNNRFIIWTVYNFDAVHPWHYIAGGTTASANFFRFHPPQSLSTSRHNHLTLGTHPRIQVCKCRH